MEITIPQLQQIYPQATSEHLEGYFQSLIEAMREAEINTTLRVAAFLAQIGHESDRLKYMSEVWGPTAAQKDYEPPGHRAKNLGNTQAGDGYKYRGAGPIQITGRSNFIHYGKLLGLDLENHPELAHTPQVGFRLAGAYWTEHKLNALADTGDFTEITQKINGGQNGAADRLSIYTAALKVLQP